MDTTPVTLLVMYILAVTANNFPNYLDNYELYDYLKQVNDDFPNISHLYSIGTSGRGEDIWVLMITLASPEEIRIPNVKIMGNLHGDEPVGRELIISFIEMLLVGYQENDKHILDLLKKTKIHLLPSLNPDGFAEAIEGECSIGPGRNNANNVDLNRDFPPVFGLNDRDLFRNRETETQAIIQWMTEINFVLSISIHAGSLVVVYPYDEYNPEKGEIGDSLTDDNDVFTYLARKYAINTHGSMYESCPEKNQKFKDGITNGASWYSVRGTMADYNYHYHGCMELTVEVSCCKYPHPSKLNEIKENNLKALLAVVKEVHLGVKGVIKCAGSPAVSLVTVLGRNMTIQTTEIGEYWRILLPGRYFLMIESGTCKTETVTVEIPKPRFGKLPQPVILNVDLKKLWEERASGYDEIELEVGISEDRFNTTGQEILINSTFLYENKTFPEILLYSAPKMEKSTSLSTTINIKSFSFLIIFSGIFWVLWS